MRIPRFHCPGAASARPGETVELDERESHHLTRVLRRTTGDAVRLLSGAGDDWHGVVAGIDGPRARIRLERRLERTPGDSAPSRAQIRTGVGVAVARGGVFELALEHLVELGADEITPLLCQRGVVRLSGPDEADKKRARWLRILESACKQSGRRVLPVLYAPVEFTDWILQESGPASTRSAGTASPAPSTGLWIAEPRGATRTLFEEVEEWVARRLREADEGAAGPPPPGRALVGIGPEGGFAPEELNWARERNVPCVLLGENVLRVATAVAAAITAIRLAIEHAAP